MKHAAISTVIPESISAAEAGTLPGLLKRRIERTPELPAYQQYERKENRWVTYCWQDIGKCVARWQMGLKKESLEPGDRVAIMVHNSIEWVCFEQAALALGLVVVPLYTWDSSENLMYLLKDSGSRLLLIEKAEQWLNLVPHASSFPELDTVICLENKPLAMSPHIAIATMSTWLPDDGGEISLHGDDPDSLATIVYTSGTTGPAKGVMLSHKNILWNAEAILKVIPCHPSDVLLSFLPLSHTFERTAGYYTPMMAGSSVAYSRSMESLGEDLRTIRPTIIISVPRIYEKVYTKVWSQLQKKNPFVRWLFQLTLATGWHHFEAEQGRAAALPFWEQLLWPLLQRLVAAKIMERLGGRIRLAVSGGAPLQEVVSRFFLSLGLPLIQGYGLTEAAPVVSANTLERNIPASVGPPLPDVQCRIGHDSELLVKSPGLMSGYWNQPDKSKEVIDSEGWLSTGDVVEIKSRDIYIRGRLKEIIVTSTGEKIPPADLEMTIAGDPLFDHVMVVGEGMPYLAALLVLHRSQWNELARKCGLDPTDGASLHAPVARRVVVKKIQALLHEFPSTARIRRVGLLLDEWSIKNGLLTPTLKLKREEIESRYAETINELYKGHDVPL
ncbi:MAG: long-chain fatty acid--CoA ligase [Proteobacteria bacterium]|nr:long-chain fatty acid--CoA ligase [Pseudomonadota bacterium]MBU1060754.1 long-chain fatty acid--CoA ligase [Pseudomonadota bacterium]